MSDLELKNAKNEILEIFDKCTRCGMCKELCPVFRFLRQEELSPRGHAILLSNKVIDKLVYQCSLCKVCEEKCPFNLEICKAIKRARQVLALKNQDNEILKEMAKKISESKNPHS
jgi:glycolate oxidase iron-sulfur subunit